MITNPSAKQRFLESGHAPGFQDLIVNPVFTEAADMALLEFQEKLQFGEGGRDLNSAAGNFLRLSGARDFLFILKNMAQKEAPISKQPDKLNLR